MVDLELTEERTKIIEKWLPNKWTTIAYKYFGKNSTTSKIKIITIINFIICFVIAAILDQYKIMNMRNIYLFIGSLSVIIPAIIMIPAWYMNNYRFKKMSKELNLSFNDTNKLITIYKIKNNITY